MVCRLVLNSAASSRSAGSLPPVGKRPERMNSEIWSNTWSDLRPPLSGRKRPARVVLERFAIATSSICLHRRCCAGTRPDAEVNLLHLLVLFEVGGLAFHLCAAGQKIRRE